ncbi:MAG: IPT/TIG domain-containing protein [Armatimonadota bacterium]
MKKVFLIIFLFILSFILFGCSGGSMFGGGTSQDQAKSGSGSMSITVHWPEAAKSTVLSSAYSLKFNVCTQIRDLSGVTIYRREIPANIMKRQSSSASTESKRLEAIPVGQKVLIVQAYDSNATELGYATSRVEIKQGDNDEASVSLANGVFGYDIFGISDASPPVEGVTPTNPYVLRVYPEQAYAGDSIAISGDNFGFEQGSSTVAINGAEATDIIYWGNKYIKCTVPAGGTLYGNIIVTVDGNESNGVPFKISYQTNAPYINGISPVSGLAGASVTILGSGFGFLQGSSTVSFNGTATNYITEWGNGRIVCEVPSGATTGNVVVTVNNVSSNGVYFTVSQTAADWVSVFMPAGKFLYSVWVAQTGQVYIGESYPDRFVHKLSGGSDGSIVAVFPEDVTVVNSIWGTGYQNIYVGLTSNLPVHRLSHYTTGMWLYQTISDIEGSASTMKIWGTSDQNIFAAVSKLGVTSWGGKIYKYDGFEWTEVSSSQEPIYSIHGYSAGKIYYVGAGGTICYSGNNGDTWIPVTSSTTQRLNDVWVSATGKVYAVGMGGTIVYYNGTGWGVMYSGTNQNLYGVWGTSDTNIYAVGASGTILHYDGNNGKFWGQTTSGTTNNLYDIEGISSSYIYVVGNNSTILRYSGGNN